MAESTSTITPPFQGTSKHAETSVIACSPITGSLFIPIPHGDGPGQSDTDESHERGDASDDSQKHELQDQTNLLPFKQLMFIFSGLSCALFCSFLDQTIISTALPTLGHEFKDDAIVSWVGTSYLLTSTVCQPLYGRLSDIFGRKAILSGSMMIFLIGSVLCAISRSMSQLIAFRALQGIGGGGILTAVQTVVSDVVTLEQRGKYEGILGAVVSVANAVGPLVGGIFSQKVSWRWCFYINIPLTSLAILVVIFGLPLKRVEGDIKKKLGQIDYAGCLLMLAWAILILIPVSWGGTMYAWNSAGVLVPLVLGFALLVPFIYVEKVVAKLPIIPTHIFRNGTVFGVLFGGFFTGFMFYVNLYYLPQFYQVVRGASPIMSGVLIIPLIITQSLVSLTSGFIVSITGDYLIQMNAGYFLWTISCGLLTLISPDISDAKLVGLQILSGIGSGSTFMTGLIAMQASLPRQEMAVATGVRNFIRLLGGTIALAASAAILNNSIKAELDSVIPTSILKSIVLDPTRIHSPDLGLTVTQQSEAILAYTHGIRNIYYFLIPCCAICFLVTLFFVKGQKSLKREDDERLKEEGKVWAAQNTGFRLDRQRKDVKSEPKLVTIVRVSPDPLDPEKGLQ